MFLIKCNNLFGTCVSRQFRTPILKIFSNRVPSRYLVSVRTLGSVPILGVQNNISPLQIKKRIVRKKNIVELNEKSPGLFNVLAFSTASEYNLEELMKGLREQDLYEAKPIENNVDVVHVVAKYKVENEPHELFFFREGSVIMWNIRELEASNVLSFLRNYEQDSYSDNLIHNEGEYMNYRYKNEGYVIA